MAKRRKRTNSKVPAKGRLRDMADQLWSLAVKEDWGYACAVCNHRGDLNSHHLIPRQHELTRYTLRNGCCLCRRCHQFDPDVSPHQNAAGWLLWLHREEPNLAQWYNDTILDGGHKRFSGIKNADYYIAHIQRLREYVDEDDFVRIVGKRFAAYLEEL